MKLCVACRKRFDADDFCCPVCGHTPESRNGHVIFAPELAVGYDGFNADLFASLAEVEVGNFWFESRNRLLIWAFGRYFPNAETFFEIGCGTGFVLSGLNKEFQGLRFFGSDMFTEGFAYATTRTPEATFFQMDARKIPYENEFDVIGAFDVIEHIEEDEAVLKQMYQACKHQGGIILTVPQHAFLWSYMDDFSCHVRRYQMHDLKTKVEQAGFKVVRITSYVSILLPLLIIFRLKNQLLPSGIDPISDLRIRGLRNTILKRILDLERFMIRLGLNFPAGGSLILIARK